MLASWLAAACSSSPSVGSIGVVLGRHKHSGALHVREAPPGLTGDKAGLRVGDRVKMIDGLLVDRMEPQRIRDLLRGPVGSRVTLTVIRGDRVLHIPVTREPLGRREATPASSASSTKR